MECRLNVKYMGAGTFEAAKRLIQIASIAAVVVIGPWSIHAADLPTPKKPLAPSTTAPKAPATQSSPTLRTPQIQTTPESTPSGSRRSGGGTTTSTTTTREPVPDQDESDESETPPCDNAQSKLGASRVLPLTPTAPATSRGSRPCPEADDSEDGSEAASEPDGDDDGSDVDGDERDVEDSDEYPYEDEERGGGYADESSEEAGPPVDYDELTGKVPGFTPFGSDESGSSEGSTVEGGRPWYEKLGKPGGGRPPVDDDEE